MEELINPQRDSVRLFLARWYGLGDDASDSFPDVPSVPGIPRALVDWHRWAAATGVDIIFQDYPVPPAELTRTDDGMIVFWVENQSGYYWAFDPDLEEHQVFFRESASDVWQDSGEVLERFLLHCTVHEAILGAEGKFSAVVPEPVLEDALTAFAALPFLPSANESPSARLFCSGDALARVAPPPAGYAREGESSRMLTIATVPGADVRKYRAGLESYVPAGAGRRPPVEVPVEDIPF